MQTKFCRKCDKEFRPKTFKQSFCRIKCRKEAVTFLIKKKHEIPKG